MGGIDGAIRGRITTIRGAQGHAQNKASECGKQGEIMSTKIEKYGNRNWAVYLVLPDGEPELVAVTVYKRGAASVEAILKALIVAKNK